MTPLVELYEPANLARVLAWAQGWSASTTAISTPFRSIWNTRCNCGAQIPADRIVVGESGIRSRQDVERLEAAGVQAMLVGETLMARPDVGAAVDELLSLPRPLISHKMTGLRLGY